MRRHFLSALLLGLLLPIFAFAEVETIPVQGGELTIRAVPTVLSALPRGAQRVELLTLELRASCLRDVVVTELRIRQTGLGDSADIAGVYLLRGNERLTRAGKFSSGDQTVTLRPHSLTIRACTMERVDAAIDLDPSTAVGAEYRLEIPQASDIVSDAGILRGTFPIQNRAQPRGSIAPLPAGEITVTFLSLPGRIQAISDQPLARFRVEANGEAHHILRAITLTNEGSARGSDLRDLYLVTSRGQVLTPMVRAMDDERVILPFSAPFVLKQHQSATFELRGRAWTRRRTVRFVLEESSDLQAESVQRVRGR